MRSDKLPGSYRAAASLSATLVWIKPDSIKTASGRPRNLKLLRHPNELGTAHPLPVSCSGDGLVSAVLCGRATSPVSPSAYGRPEDAAFKTSLLSLLSLRL
jgi:hypothetical protein